MKTMHAKMMEGIVGPGMNGTRGMSGTMSAHHDMMEQHMTMMQTMTKMVVVRMPAPPAR